jgi:hypothetical protein
MAVPAGISSRNPNASARSNVRLDLLQKSGNEPTWIGRSPILATVTFGGMTGI